MAGGAKDSRVGFKAERAHERLDRHEDVHDVLDTRISRNERYRLQAQGALKVIAIILGSGLLLWVGQTLLL